jgi:hypothetical protein
VQKFLVIDSNELIAVGVECGGQPDALIFTTVCFQRPLAIKAKTDFGAPKSHTI